jgi:Skp family chaperone for outer membrane proteins
MKKYFLSIAMLAVVAGISSCGSKSSFESDVKKMGNYQCDMQKLMAKDPSDEKAKKDLEDLRKEIEDYRAKMEKKYADKKDDKDMNEKADKIMDEIREKCK